MTTELEMPPVVVRNLTDLSPAEKYFNREMSWLQFNHRVLEQANEPRHPLLERVRFLAIFSNNLNEFFMVRVGGLNALVQEKVHTLSLDGRTPAEQLYAINEQLDLLLAERTHIWEDVLRPLLAEQKIFVWNFDEIDTAGQAYLATYFKSQIYPLLTPLAVDPGRPFPHISSLSLNLAVELELAPGRIRFARLKIPPNIPRLVQIPDPADPTHYRFIWMEELIRAHLQDLFPGVTIRGAFAFRLARDADQALAESEVSDLMLAMENHLRRRHFGRVVRLEVEEGMPQSIQELLIENIEASARSLEIVPAPLDFTALFELPSKVNRPDLTYAPFVPNIPLYFTDDDKRSFFEVLREKDRMVHHPYDSFEPVLDFLETAATDKSVVAIKQTLYRMGNNPRIVNALLNARRAGKQVAVLVELKARFDEETNIEWARTLEDEGVHVVYGLLGLKTHAKVTLVIRREKDVLRRYVHVGTGNYNASTARMYTDIGLFTSRPEVGQDASDLFNFLTGFSNQEHYETLLVAPVELRQRLLEMIEREANHAREGRLAGLFFKMNSLTDRTIINALYEASQAGVEVRLIVRGACCLRPGIEGISENIEVRSLVGRFLEHSRIFYFENGGDTEVYIGSADFMARNLDRRVEVAAPVVDTEHRNYLLNHVLHASWNDTVNNYHLNSDGSYTRLTDPNAPLNSHDYLMALHGCQPIQKYVPNVPPAMYGEGA
jgi:polyphosphate kinase